MSSANKEHVIQLQTASQERLFAAIGKYKPDPDNATAIAADAGIISMEDYTYTLSSECSGDDREAVRMEVIRQLSALLDQAAHWITKAIEPGSGIGGSLLQAAIAHYDKIQQALSTLRSPLR